jgi:hypothetical protein
MSAFRIDFDALPWEGSREAVRMKAWCGDGRTVRIVEFHTTEGPDDFCEQGHIGYVLAGALTIDIAGERVEFKAGDGVVLPAGHATRHRGVRFEPGTRLLMIEDHS